MSKVINLGLAGLGVLLGFAAPILSFWVPLTAKVVADTLSPFLLSNVFLFSGMLVCLSIAAFMYVWRAPKTTLLAEGVGDLATGERPASKSRFRGLSWLFALLAFFEIGGLLTAHSLGSPTNLKFIAQAMAPHLSIIVPAVTAFALLALAVYHHGPKKVSLHLLAALVILVGIAIPVFSFWVAPTAQVVMHLFPAGVLSNIFLLSGLVVSAGVVGLFSLHKADEDVAVTPLRGLFLASIVFAFEGAGYILTHALFNQVAQLNIFMAVFAIAAGVFIFKDMNETIKASETRKGAGRAVAHAELAAVAQAGPSARRAIFSQPVDGIHFNQAAPPGSGYGRPPAGSAAQQESFGAGGYSS